MTAFLWKVFFTLPLNLIRVERYFSARREKKTVIIPVVRDVHGGQETGYLRIGLKSLDCLAFLITQDGTS